MSSIITTRDLQLSYNKNQQVLENINLDIKRGEFAIITGKSGSGKSTLFKSFYGDLIPRKGFLNVCGCNIDEYTSKTKLKKLRRKIGVIFQDYKLINEWTITKNIMLPLLINGYSASVCLEQAKKLLKHVHLLHQAKKYPLELSGGEQQRAAVARAMAHNPEIILADEPTGNLDQYSSDIIWELLKALNEQLNTTVLVVTHRIPSMIPKEHKHYKISQKQINDEF
ncbi:MAG: Cell division transporter, ATP-binding protein FtsE (TC 3.A.5.1.1) [uncultured Campylobacterales bacterium]|uniref:Cell division transporter, ATP-binding protein FtsE (TC 3.A.5.1.1) n=1 Tax=uncultured Campylobacterales bacterium TaxID=352960 RepID=A0A6S6T2Z8_9BACT|nr:MAG: Cell division transporter, ATP-binding protein FtsE (TC 3.A.5.1.1) [uncultured Campylobacterales bacterium]